MQVKNNKKNQFTNKQIQVIPVVLLKEFDHLQNIFVTTTAMKYFDFLKDFAPTVQISFFNHLKSQKPTSHLDWSCYSPKT